MRRPETKFNEFKRVHGRIMGHDCQAGTSEKRKITREVFLFGESL